MKALTGFWQFLNTDVREIPWSEVAEQGIGAIASLPDAAAAWQDNAPKIQKLAPYVQQAEPLLKALDDPIAQLAIAGLPFVSIGINLLKLGLAMTKVEPTFESSVAIVAQLAYLQSLETVLERLQDEESIAKLKQLSLKSVIERQLARLNTTELTAAQARQITTQFRESALAEQFGAALKEQLLQAELEDGLTRRLVDQVVWGSDRYFHQAIAAAGEDVEPLAEFYRTGGVQAQKRYASIDDYLRKQIEPLPLEQVFDENNPKVCFKDLYVRLQVQPLTQEGEVRRSAIPLCSHAWTQQILEQTEEPRKVMFIEGDAGRGKSVFCRMIANWVHTEFGDAFIPLRIRLRDIRNLATSLTATLTECPELEQVQFVRGRSDWLTDKNTRFLIILDGFDELLLEGRATGGLKEFLQQVIDFQQRSHHQLLVTGRPLALQGIDRLITQKRDLERVRLESMGDPAQEQWLTKWQAIFGEASVSQLKRFLTACPEDITDILAREPLLLYLLARLNREGRLTHEMFADTQIGSNQEIQAKLRIYRASVDWVLEKQRQDENQRLSGLDLDDLREVLQEAALCVVQSRNETARLEMVKQRFKASSNPVAALLRQAQETTGQSEDRALNNLLTTFYLKPGERDAQGSVEFAHKSFGEYLFAERLIAAFENWTEVDQRSRYRMDDRALNEQVYDVFGYGGLSQEIVAYLFELLEENNKIDRVRLFKRLHIFYLCWCQSEFLDAAPNENLPQKKLLQLLDQEVRTGLKQVDVFAGLNVMIVLFKLHAAAQPKGYPHTSENTPQPEIWFHPCGHLAAEDFEPNRLLKIIYYADALDLVTFAKTVGPHLSSADLSRANLSSADLSRATLSSADLYSADLSSADLSRANLYSADLSSATLSSATLSSATLSSADLSSATLFRANLSNATLSSANLASATLSSATLYGADLSRANLYSANLSSANLSSANFYSANLSSALLIKTRLSDAQNLNIEQMEGQYSPLLCNAVLPPDLSVDPNRDWDRLAGALHKRYPSRLKTLEEAVEWVEARRPR